MELVVKHELFTNGYKFYILIGDDLVAQMTRFDLGFLDDVENWESTFEIFAVNGLSSIDMETRLRKEEKLKKQFVIIADEGWMRKEREDSILYTLNE